MTKVNPWFDPLSESMASRLEYYREALKKRDVHDVITELEKEIMEVERAAFRDGWHKDLFQRSEELRVLSRKIWNWGKFGLDYED
jgi:hypothetical protein